MAKSKLPAILYVWIENHGTYNEFIGTSPDVAGIPDNIETVISYKAGTRYRVRRNVKIEEAK